MSLFKSAAKAWSKTFQFALSQWFFIVLAIFIIISRFAPNFARHGGLIRAEYSIGYGAVAIIFLQGGLSMSSKQLLVNIANWRAHSVVLIFSFLVSSAVAFAFCYAVACSNDKQIDNWLLVGIILTMSSPTTVASNVVMTREAQGNDVLCLCEVFIGNVLGAFLTPAVVQMYLSSPHFEFGNPAAGSSTRRVYADVMKQIGLSVFVPLFVGQVLQNLFPEKVKWTLQKFRLNKVGSFCLLLIMFSSFSTAFYQHAFTSVSHISIVFIVLFNVGVYLFLTVICFVCARPFFILKLFPNEPTPESSSAYKIAYKIFRPFYYSRRDAVAILFCGPAKTAALGVSLISAQYGDNFSELGKLLVPLVLYQSEQVVAAKLLVPLARRWILQDVSSAQEPTEETPSKDEKDDQMELQVHSDATSAEYTC
ncbi:LAMI_0E05160g1_1 [Lachancea mirantina]|uniref:LAMI_0E05160g1_1 n=1 Tax=Lachancea mirantina TaxID=1230905 RepID=A0A1G4JKV0_9SACH|nr:LAMI_0E05160g1_1 [Lachancea mirantina]